MKNDEFNPEKKYQEWLNRPARQRLKKKRRLTVFLFLLNIVIIVLAYMIISKNRNHPQYTSVRAEIGNIEYRFSITDNNETRSYGITLTISNMTGDIKMIYPGKDLSQILINYHEKTIIAVPVINNTSKMKLETKPLIFNSKLDKNIIDVYLEENGFIKKKNKGFLNLKENLYSLEGVLYIKDRPQPLIIRFDHEAAR